MKDATCVVAPAGRRRQPPSTSRVRWGILALLVGFSTASYVERVNLSVAGRFMRDDIGISDVQLGWMFSAFLLAYTLAQIPSGYLSDRFGPRKVLGHAAIAWFVITICTAAVVDLVGSMIAAVVAALILLRFALGLAEAPTYPAATKAVANWFPSHERSTANSIIQSASYAGSALTMPLMVAASIAWGWKGALAASAIPALAIGTIWWLYARDHPEDHHGVSERELAHIRSGEDNDQTDLVGSFGFNLQHVLVLSISYFFRGAVGYVFFFWFFTYLVEERQFTMVESGWVAALPTTAAALFALLGGWVSEKAEKARPGSRRLLLFWGSCCSGLFLLVGAYSNSAMLAVFGFVAAIAIHGLMEATYWTLAIELGQERAGFAAGTMNTLSNLGGVISTAVAPLIVVEAGWAFAMLIAAVASAAGGVIALGLPRRPNLRKENA